MRAVAVCVYWVVASLNPINWLCQNHSDLLQLRMHKPQLNVPQNRQATSRNGMMSWAMNRLLALLCISIQIDLTATTQCLIQNTPPEQVRRELNSFQCPV